MRARERRDAVVFAYAYAASERDAVARVIDELAKELRSQGLQVRVLGLPERLIVAPGGTPCEKFRRLSAEVGFLLRSVGVVVRRLRHLRAFVSVDVPSGLPLVGALARVLSRGRVKDVAWVMDLYRLATPQSGTVTNIRSSVELLALRASGDIVTIGSCMASTIAELTGREADVIPLWHRALRRSDPVGGASPLQMLYSGSARDLHPLQGLVTAIAGRDDVHLTISGSGSEVENVRAMVADVRSTNITFRGFTPENELESAYADADLHVVSLAEQMTGTCVPSKVYASMSAGRGVFYLGSPKGQAAVDVATSGAGVVVGSRDVRGINEALDDLVGRPGQVANIAQRAGQFFDENRTVKAGGSRWRDRLLS